MQEKFSLLLQSIDSKFESWKSESLNIIVDHSPSNVEHTTLEKESELLRRKNDAQENEISLLQQELSEKNKMIQSLEKEKLSTREGINSKNSIITQLNNSIELEKKKSSHSETQIGNSLHRIKNFELQLCTLQAENNVLSISNQDTSVTITEYQKKIETLTYTNGILEGKMKQLNDCMHILRSLIRNGNPETNALSASPDYVSPQEVPCENIFILHDSLFKGVTDGITKNENLSVKKIWAPQLKDAFDIVTNMKENPKVVFLHSATNDLQHLHENDIVKYVLDIYETVNNLGIKFVWSNIVPRTDNNEINSKAYLVNAMVCRELVRKEAAFILRNENFYDGDMINHFLLNEDGVHLTDRGTSVLAQNVKRAICRCLDIPFVSHHNNKNRPQKSNRRRNYKPTQ